MEELAPLVRRVRDAGVGCEVVVRPGLPADQILSFLREREVDRVVMGTHSPGPIGKLLVGSVAEAVLRTAKVPVYIVGPETVDGTYRSFATARSCAPSACKRQARWWRVLPRSWLSLTVRADSAARDPAAGARGSAGRPHPRPGGGRSARADSATLKNMIAVQTIVVPGDPTEELLYQARAQQADLIVLGAQGASAFAAITRHGVVYKVLAHAHCPVITLSPVVLAECGVHADKAHPSEMYMAGVF